MKTSRSDDIQQITGKDGVRVYANIPGAPGPYPSVTTILKVIAKEALINWAAGQERLLCTEVAVDLAQEGGGFPGRAKYGRALKERLGQQRAHNKALEKASEIGTEAHKLCEWHMLERLNGAGVKMPEVKHAVAYQCFLRFEKWADEVNLQPILVEQKVWSHAWAYAGTMDLFAELTWRGQRLRALIDFKTGKRVYDEGLLQNVAYQQALVEMKHGTPDIGLVVRLPKVAEKEPKADVVEVPGFERLWSGFIAARRLWQWQQEWKAYQKREKEEKREAELCAKSKDAPVPV